MSLVDYSPWVCTELDTTERLYTAQHRGKVLAFLGAAGRLYLGAARGLPREVLVPGKLPCVPLPLFGLGKFPWGCRMGIT